jgi:GNAT superfamily N-acetyltransferase
MHEDITFKLNPTVEAHAISDLRASVGWDRQDEDFPAALRGYWATVSGFDSMGTLVAWCAVLSDGVRHAVLLDVIVHPAYQRQGVGRKLVATAIEHIQTQAISIIHVDFLPEYTSFYEKCGFSIGLGGIIEG